MLAYHARMKRIQTTPEVIVGSVLGFLALVGLVVWARKRKIQGIWKVCFCEGGVTFSINKQK